MFQRILLALDADDAGAVATSFVIAMARHARARVHVVHVSEALVGARGIAGEAAAQVADVVAGALREMQLAGVSASGATYRTTKFDVAGAIADAATRWQADVVVVGSRRRRPLLRRSIRSRIARATPLPVLVAPAPLRVPKDARTPDGVPAHPGSPVRS